MVHAILAGHYTWTQLIQAMQSLLCHTVTARATLEYNSTQGIAYLDKTLHVACAEVGKKSE